MESGSPAACRTSQAVVRHSIRRGEHPRDGTSTPKCPRSSGPKTESWFTTRSMQLLNAKSGVSTRDKNPATPGTEFPNHRPAMKLHRTITTQFFSLVVISATAAEFPLREDFDFKIPFLGVQRSVSWKAEPGRCTVSIHYGSTDTIPTFPNPPSDQVWILTADGKTIPMDGSSMFVGATTGLGGASYQHLRLFNSEAVTNAVAVVVKISTNLVVQSVVK